jgi:serine protease Do
MLFYKLIQWVLALAISVSCGMGMGARKEKKNSHIASSTESALKKSQENGGIQAEGGEEKEQQSLVIPSPQPSLSSSYGNGSLECACHNWIQIAPLCLPAVVNITATHQSSESKERNNLERVMPQVPPGSLFEELFRDFLDQAPLERAPRKVQSVGSGFIFRQDDKSAFVATNAHVVNESKSIKVTLHDKSDVDATLVALDERSDIAILKFKLKEGISVRALAWGNSDALKVAEPVMAIGNPFGFGSTVTTGIISYKGRYLPTGGAQQDFEFLQHSAQINMGNSGGCLLNEKGEIVGINTAIITPNAGNVGIGFAIPSNDALKVINQLLKYGYIRRGYLGIKIQMISEELRASMGLSKDDGVLVIGSITNDGPAKDILEVGDVILDFDGKKITDPYLLPRVVANTEIGKKVYITVLRQKSGETGSGSYKKMTLTLKVGELPKELGENSGKNRTTSKDVEVLETLGLKIRPLDQETKSQMERERKKAVHGVLVESVDRRQASADFPILVKKGDIIESAHGKAIHTPGDFVKAIEKAKKDRYDYVLLYVSRPGEDSRFLPLNLKSSKPKDPQSDSEPRKFHKEER